MATAALPTPAVYHDVHRRVCLVVSRSKDSVAFIAMAVAEAFRVTSLRASAFDAAYKPLEGYPAEKAAKLFVRYAVDTGATKDVMTALGKLTKVSPEEITWATSGEALAQAKAAERGGGFAAKPRADGQAGGGTMSKMFCDLILEGGRTDEAIFAIVAKAYGLGPEKIRYVASYRCTLKKKGLNPPERIK